VVQIQGCHLDQMVESYLKNFNIVFGSIAGKFDEWDFYDELAQVDFYSDLP
jgi:hypothetical protein